MEMELVVDPDDVAKLARLKEFQRQRTGSGRPRAVRTLWHDSPDRALTARNVILAETREGWHLEALRPDEAAWPPAVCPPILEQAEQRAGLMHRLPEPLAAIASCEGRDIRHDLSVDGEPVSLTLRRGTLRSVPAEHAFCRAVIAGPDEAVRSVALSLTDGLRVGVPPASLAAEALALADGSAPAPRRLGAPALPEALHGGSAAASFRYVIGHLLDVVLHFAPLAAADRHGPEPVHQARVAVRRARSVISVFRHALGGPAVDTAGHRLKELGAKLGPTRDWDVFVSETAPAIGSAMASDQRLIRLLAGARRRREECHTALRDYLHGPDFRRFGIELAWLAAAEVGIETTEAGAMKLTDYAVFVLQRRWKKLTTAGRDIDALDTAGLHGLRLRAKRARYAAEIFAPLFPGRHAPRFLRRLARLQDALGVLNDASVAHALLDELGGASGRHGYAVGLVTGFSAARAGSARPDALAAWKKLRQATPFWAN
jgi:triphosphatase